MTLPGLVLVHGGECWGTWWDLTVDELRRQAPQLGVVAVDLPGHGGRPGDLTNITIADCVDAAVAQIEQAGLTEVIVVGHSLAGLTVPGVVATLGSARVREMILAACSVPAQGKAVADTLSAPLAWYARRAARRGKPTMMPTPMYEWLACNGMTREQRRFVSSRRQPESSRLPVEPVDRSALPDDIPRTWIMTLRDRSQSPRNQFDSIAALGGVHTIIPIDTCHNLMISEPKALAHILIERCRLRSRDT